MALLPVAPKFGPQEVNRLSQIWAWFPAPREFELHATIQRGGGGAGSEVWNRVYMIAPVKKFGRVRLSTISFKINMAEGADMEGR